MGHGDVALSGKGPGIDPPQRYRQKLILLSLLGPSWLALDAFKSQIKELTPLHLTYSQFVLCLYPLTMFGVYPNDLPQLKRTTFNKVPRTM